MQFYEPLQERFRITAFASQHPFHDTFAFPVVKCWSPMDIPGFPFRMSVLNRLFTDAHYLHGLEEKLRGFDLVHTAETYYHYTQQALNAKDKGYVRRVVTTVLENIPFNNEGIRGRTAFKQRALRESDHLIALTESTRQAMLLEGADPRKITVLSHFIDTGRFHPVAARTGNSPLTILFAGRLESAKGVFELLFAVKLLRLDPELATVPFRLVFVGRGSQAVTLHRLADRLGLSNMTEYMDVPYERMPEVYRTADIYTAPSKPTLTWEEQYNTTLLEAQASGLPIVTTASGGIPENVGDAALLVPPADYRALSRELKRFLLDRTLRKEYGRRARKRAETVHDAGIGAKKLAELYTRLLHE